nr:MAG: replication associated protein [Cressdnaviricota sp.]
MSTSRGWTFTLFDYSEDDEINISGIECRYVCFGREICPTTNRQHLQGYFYTTTPIRFRGAKSLLPISAHVEKARGSPEQNRTYCSKEGNFNEFGNLPGNSAEILKINNEHRAEAYRLAVLGQLDDINDGIKLQYYNTLKCIAKDNMKNPDILDHTTGIWIHGISGSGKTRSVFDKYGLENLYLKNLTKWWDGYKQQNVVLMDDFSSYKINLTDEIKLWADRYPFNAEAKGSALIIRPKRFIITSQYTISEIWTDLETQAAMNRRFIIINKIEQQAILLPDI